MYRYLCADMRRLARRFPRWLLLFLALGGLAVAVAFMGQLGLYGRWSSVTYVNTIKTMIKPLSLIIGLIEMIFIFGDDLKARTLQASIGAGLPRAGLVICKFIETCVFSLLDVILYALLTYLVGLAFQTALSGAQLRELSVFFFVQWLRVIGYTSLTMILLFFKRSLVLGVVFYIALCTRIVHGAAGMLLSIGTMENLHLDRYTLSAYLDTLQTFLIGGASGVKPLLVVLAYAAFGCLAAILLFQKRELEF